MIRRHTETELLFILIISIVLLACGCTSPAPSGNGNDTGAMAADKYVALYEEHDKVSTILEGNGTVAHMPVPCPRPFPFDYDGTLGYKGEYPAVNDDLKVMYGSYVVVEHPTGGYSTAYYKGIYGLPYTLSSGLTITGIDANGTVEATCDNATVILKAGDIWRSPVATKVENQSLHVMGDNIPFSSFVYRPFIVQTNDSWTVENKGIYPKANISI